VTAEIVTSAIPAMSLMCSNGPIAEAVIATAGPRRERRA
jgi:hypothetical protein